MGRRAYMREKGSSHVKDCMEMVHDRKCRILLSCCCISIRDGTRTMNKRLIIDIAITGAIAYGAGLVFWSLLLI